MIRLVVTACIYCLTLVCVVGVNAQQLMLKDYPDARVVFKSQERLSDYRLALGSYRKTQDAWQPVRQQRLSGQLTRYTLELPPNHSELAGFEFYREQLNDLRHRELFSCHARDCGASNTWANNHFKIIQLYGLDQYQHYAALEVLTDSPTPYYVSIYSVRRGNKRVYVQVDILHSDKARAGTFATNPNTLASILEGEGFYIFPGLVSDQNGRPQLQINQEHVDTLVKVLEREAQWKIGLVGHDYHTADLARQQEHSRQYAEQLKAALVAQGVAVDRLTVFGLGSLAPAGRGDLSARVEVVLLP